MRRLLWLLPALAVLAGGLWLAGRPPSAYVLKRECARFHEERKSQLTVLAYQIARADEAVRPDLRELVNHMLGETKPIAIRGWEVILVPPGARAPGNGFRVGARIDPSTRDDPAPLRGTVMAWIRADGWLARLFSWG